MKTIEITVPSYQYADHDDCLAAAARDYVREHKLSGWDLSPRWADDATREEIILCVPTFSVEVTAETITEEQILALREEAQAADPTDYRQIDLCARALTEDSATTNDEGHEIAFADWTQEAARAECARAINSARAMED